MKTFDAMKWIRTSIIHYSLFIIPATAGFALTLQTVLMLRPGMLGGVPWPLATIGIYASDVVLLVAAVIGVMRAWRIGALQVANPGGWPVFTRRRFLLAVGLLLSLAVVNAIVSADSWLSVVGWLRITALLLALAGLPYSERATRAFLGGFLVAMLGHVALGLGQFMTLEAQPSTLLGIAGHNAWTLGDAVITVPGERWLRAYGGFPHPNVLGTALLVALIAVVRWPRNNRVVSMIHDSLFIILTSALVLTFSRAALLGLVILLAVCAWRSTTRRLAIVGTFALVAAMALTWPFWTPRFTGSTPNEQRSIAERATVVRGALTILPNALVSRGHGLHALPAQMYQWYGDRDLGLLQPVHNVPFLALIEIGGIGVLVLVLVLVSLLRHPLFMIHYSLFPLVLLPSLLFDHHLWSLPVGLALVFVLAVALSHRLDGPESEFHTESVRVPSI
ncbi:O-antigen ligase family protein [Candidatus Uhrbacteria bacterium]|nr:O-antigen ligase family protein [Candidatus Uhrbacteria bacterium]